MYLLFEFIFIIISLYAAYLSYSCNNQSGQISRFIFTIIAFFLGPIYLIYYFFVNFITGNCNIKY